MHQFVAPFRYGIDVAMRLGAMDEMSVLMGVFCMLSNATATTPLPQAPVELDRYVKTIQHANCLEQLQHALCSVQFAHKLALPHRDIVLLSGE